MTFVSWHLILIGQLLLEAPDDIYSFQFSPSDPNIICGGCYNGQVVLWDISAHADRLKQPRGGNRNKKSNVLVSDELISYKMMSVFVHITVHTGRSCRRSGQVKMSVILFLLQSHWFVARDKWNVTELV